MKIFSKLFFFLQLVMVAFVVKADGNPQKGKTLVLLHCANCHVIGKINKFGGIGSTPSFQLIAGLDDGLERFATFFKRRPHPAFVTITSVTSSNRGQSYATNFEVNTNSIEDIVAFVRTLKKKNLSEIPLTRNFNSTKKDK